MKERMSHGNLNLENEMKKIEITKQDWAKVTDQLAKVAMASCIAMEDFSRAIVNAGESLRRHQRVEEAKRLHAIGHRIRMKIIHWDLILK